MQSCRLIQAVLAAWLVALAGTADAATPEVQALMEGNRAALASSSGPLAIGELKYERQEVPLFERMEVQFTLAATYRNPYDPQDVCVDAEVAAPNGASFTIPAFYSEPFEPVNGTTRLQSGVKYRSTGSPHWAVRLAPSMPGTYRLRIVASTPATGERAVSRWIEFVARPSANPGYVRIADGNRQYFENSADGTLFLPVGTNVAWTRDGEESYEHYFQQADGNQSATRVWLCHYAWLEWTPRGKGRENSDTHYAGMGYYNQPVAAGVDRMFELAEKHGQRVMLVLDDNDELRPGKGWHNWERHGYNVLNGGPCASPAEMFVSPEARTAYRNRIRYILARWGYSTSLWSINSWNDCFEPSETHLAWLRDISSYVHAVIDPVRPLQYGTNYRKEAQAISDYAQARIRELYPDKPNVMQEVFYTRDPAWFRSTLTHQLWLHAAHGIGGVMVWPHALVDETESWSVFRNQLMFLQTLPLHRGPWRALEVSVDRAASAGGEHFEHVLALEPYGDVPADTPSTKSVFTVDLNDGDQFIEGMSSRLYGRSADQKAQSLRFDFELPGPGAMIVHVRSLTGGSSRLEAYDGDRLLLERAFPGSGWRQLDRDEEYIRIPLEPGQRRVRLHLAGPPSASALVRLFIASTQEAYQRLLQPVGIGSSEAAWIYIHNTSYGEVYSKLVGDEARPVQDVALTVSGLEDGVYTVEYFDVERGIFSGEPQRLVARDGRAAVAVDTIRSACALRMTRAASGTTAAE